MATFGELLSNLATAAGVAKDNPQLIDVLSNSELASKPIPTEIATQITANLMTKDAARNNGEIKGHFYKTFASGFDEKLKEFITDFGLDDTTQAQIFAEDSVFKKYERLREKLKDAYSTAKNSTTVSGKKEAEEEIRKLNADLAAAKTAIEQARQEEATKWINDIKESQLENMLGSYEYSNDKVPKSTSIEVAKAILNRKISDSKLNPVFDPKTKSFRLLTESGLEHFNGNTPVAFKDFMDSTVAEAGLIKVSGSSGTPPPNTQPQGTPKVATAATGPKNVSSYMASLDSDLADYSQHSNK